MVIPGGPPEDPPPGRAQSDTTQGSDSDKENPYSKYYQPNAAIWSLYLREKAAEDKELVYVWLIGLDSLLLFVNQLSLPFEHKLISCRRVCLLESSPRSLLKAAVNRQETFKTICFGKSSKIVRLHPFPNPSNLPDPPWQ